MEWYGLDMPGVSGASGAVLGILGYLMTVLQTRLVGWTSEHLFLWYGSAAQMHDFFAMPWAIQATALVQGVAGAVLGLRVAWDVVHLYIVRSAGGGGDPTALLIRATRAGIGIVAVPALAKYALVFSNLAVGAVAGMAIDRPSLAAGLERAMSGHVGTEVAVGAMGPVLLLAIIVLLVLVVVQAAARGVELLLLGIIGPALAIGWVSADEGTGAGVMMHMVLLATTQAAQGLVVYLLAILGANPPPIGAAWIWVMVGTAWVAFKTPSFLRDLSHRTGMTEAAGGLGQTVAHIAIRRGI